MFPNPIREQYLYGTKVDFSKDDRPLGIKMLTFPWRDFVINKVKPPLDKAIRTSKRLIELAPQVIETAKLIRKLSSGKYINPNAKLFAKYKERFLSYEDNPSRIGLFESAYDIIKAEIEHDNYYGDRLQCQLEWIIEDILNGEWKPREKNKPAGYWKETKPYGGENTIISKIIKHKEEIKKVIGI
ncbi:MAG: hypothetical protein WC910_11200 [Bacteroidales bacterium]|jgi:hypothetical protein